MKLLKYVLISCLALTVFSCDEDEILKEEPLDFLVADNAYVSPDGINSAIVKLYNRASRLSNPNSSNSNDSQFWIGTDVAYEARDFLVDMWSNYNITTDNPRVKSDWDDAYKIVFNANVVLNRAAIDAENPIEYSDENLRTIHLAEAAFFRAWGYRALVHLFGDVPLIIEELDEAKRDYTRTPKAEVIAQMIEDFNFAKDNLPTINAVRQMGRVPKAAAYHYLAETYIANNQNQEAITASSWVIDNSDYELMTDRFGSRLEEPGDVYWDLFRLNNQNRSAGNTETIWAYQDEYLTPGGDIDARWERLLGGEYNRYTAKGETNPATRTFIYEATYNGGRAQGYIRPTSHVTHGIWNSDRENDIRNSEFNIKRQWWVDNPESVHYNDTIDVNDPADVAKFMGGPRGVEEDTNRYVYPYIMKFVRINNHVPEELRDGSLNDAQMALATPEHIALIESYGGVGPRLQGGARRYRADIYALRLAETYLLRAEAYLNLGNTTAAADDINQVRERSSATPVVSADVDIDYILDERLRELIFEEPRRITLGRLGLLYDRVSRYNNYAKDNIQPFHNLYPIPLSDILSNAEAELEQNPGY
jgi:hypothetical protein